jgi:glycosyltransferase involved in cell wall biosynthesis
MGWWVNLNNFLEFDGSEHMNRWPWNHEIESRSPAAPDESNWPRISIVTPSFNQAPYIEETIRSVLLQNYPNLEYLIIDGGSTDGSVDIIKKYEPWLTYWVSEKDGGQSQAINKGWHRATGELLAWLNSDDYIEPDVLRKVANSYIQSRDLCPGLIYGRANVIDHGREFLFSIGESFELARLLIELINPFPQPSVFIAREALERIGFLDESMHYAMDLDLFTRIALSSPVIFANEIWSTVRYMLDTKTSRNPSGFMADQLLMLHKLDAIQSDTNHYDKLRNSAYARAYIRTANYNFKDRNYAGVIMNLIHALRIEPFFTAKEIRKKIKP